MDSKCEGIAFCVSLGQLPTASKHKHLCLPGIIHIMLRKLCLLIHSFKHASLFLSFVRNFVHSFTPTGVPQGSILGSLLFILYINYIHLACNKFNAILYADDTTLCSFKYNRYINDNNNISNHINAELNEISEWLSCNKLCLNVLR